MSNEGLTEEQIAWLEDIVPELPKPEAKRIFGQVCNAARSWLEQRGRQSDLLMEYGEHKKACGIHDGNVCDCGLFDLILSAPTPSQPSDTRTRIDEDCRVEPGESNFCITHGSPWFLGDGCNATSAEEEKKDLLGQLNEEIRLHQGRSTECHLLRQQLQSAEEEKERLQEELDLYKICRAQNHSTIDVLNRDKTLLTQQLTTLRKALEWALPLADMTYERCRIERIQAGHKGIQGIRSNGTVVVGLWQDEIDKQDRARAALLSSLEKKNV